MAFDLKDESEVKEYIEKLGVEYRFGCYSEKNPEVCHLLGDYLEGIKKDFEKAAKVYRSNCDDYGYSKSCLKYGKYIMLGKGHSGNKGEPVQAYKYFDKGCDMNEPEACLHTGLILLSKTLSNLIKRDIPKGFEKLIKSCEMNNATACFYLSGMHISGVPKNGDIGTVKIDKNTEFLVEKDMNKAFQFAYKACELRNIYACANLSQMYARGDGTEKNEKNAEKYKKLALEMQEELRSQQQLGFQQGIPQS